MKIYQPNPNGLDGFSLSPWKSEINDNGWGAPDFLPGDPDGKKFQAKASFEVEVDKAERSMEVWDAAKARRLEKRQEYLRSTEGQDEAADRFGVDNTTAPEEDWEERDPIVDGVLYRGTANRIVGPSGSLKSFAAIDLANHIHLGREWYGREVTKTNALYIAAEGALGIPGRKQAWEQFHNESAPTGVIYRRKPVQLSDEEAVRDMISWCRRENIGFIVIDTQAKSTVGVNENDNSEMTVIMSTVDTIAQESGAAVLLVHHPAGDKAGEGGRGAKGVFGALDGEIHAERKDKNSIGDRVELTFPKLKDDPTGDAISMYVTQVDLESPRRGHASSLVLTPEQPGGTPPPQSHPPVTEVLPDPTEKQRVILRAIGAAGEKGNSPSGLALKILEDGNGDLSAQLVRNRLLELNSMRLVEQPKPREPWYITPLGNSVIAKEMIDRVKLEDRWTDRAPRVRRDKHPVDEVSQGFIDLPLNPPINPEADV